MFPVLVSRELYEELTGNFVYPSGWDEVPVLQGATIIVISEDETTMIDRRPVREDDPTE